ncbi:Zinc finger protein 112 [Eumeta japonica]|uniref:Zinc finger protein 112 n=1 Tax=Eumeta variegata TaxID=151549 RepID=A0A4C1YQC5_EUMVA|nr:Zinc finger protein 112 [Eumeta japonica]
MEDDNVNDVDTPNSDDDVGIEEERLYNHDDVVSQIETDDDNLTDKLSRFPNKRARPRELSYTSSPEGARCNECGNTFSSDSLLRVHYCINYPKFQCEHCGKAFMTTMALNNHLMLHNEKQYQCGNCTKTFSSLKLLGKHQALEHSNFGEKGVYACEYCNKKFRYSMSKERHMQKKHEVVLYSCPLCNYKSKRQYLKSHLANKHHIGEKKHECIYCNKKFSRAIALKEHLRIHLDDRKDVCRVCNKHFIHKCSLKGHIQTHMKRGEYEGDPRELLEHAERTDDEYEPLENFSKLRGKDKSCAVGQYDYDRDVNMPSVACNKWFNSVQLEKMFREETTVASTEQTQDGMVEEFLLEDEELDEIGQALSRDGQAPSIREWADKGRSGLRGSGPPELLLTGERYKRMMFYNPAVDPREGHYRGLTPSQGLGLRLTIAIALEPVPTVQSKEITHQPVYTKQRLQRGLRNLYLRSQRRQRLKAPDFERQRQLYFLVIVSNGARCVLSPMRWFNSSLWAADAHRQLCDQCWKRRPHVPALLITGLV